jgi:hypothetical protein
MDCPQLPRGFYSQTTNIRRNVTHAGLSEFVAVWSLRNRLWLRKGAVLPELS